MEDKNFINVLYGVVICALLMLGFYVYYAIQAGEEEERYSPDRIRQLAEDQFEIDKAKGSLSFKSLYYGWKDIFPGLGSNDDYDSCYSKAFPEERIYTGSDVITGNEVKQPNQTELYAETYNLKLLVYLTVNHPIDCDQPIANDEIQSMR